MWPWEHAAAGYLAYSVGKRLLGRDPPGEVATVGLAIGTQLPDLIDKPLSWGLGLVPTGYAIGHSVLVLIPVSLVLGVSAVRSGNRFLLPLLAGYWTHLVTDVLDPLRYGDPPLVRRVLWPVVESDPYDRDLGLDRGLHYVQEFVESLASTPLWAVIVLYGLLPLGTIALWVADGRPGVALLRGVLDPRQ